MSTVLNQVHQGKWGFHPCSKEEYLELKAIFKKLLTSFRSSAKHWRWFRKLPQHRYEKEPENGYWDIHSVQEFLTMRKDFTLILELYRNARYPKKTAEEVQPMNYPSWFDQMKKALG
jgi:hypothetical protein